MDPPFTPKRLPTTAAAATEPTQFRILCPSAKTGALIGKGGSVIRHLQSLTGAKIRILDDPSMPPSDERIILIHANGNHSTENHATNSEEDHSNLDSENVVDAVAAGDKEEMWSGGQKALVRVFERMVKWEGEGEDEGLNEGVSVGCRMLVGSNQVGCVLGRGGRVVDKIRQDTGAQVRVLPKDHIPIFASPGDELIQITGNFSAVKKALLSVSSCLQDSLRADGANSVVTNSSGATFHGNAIPAQVDPFPQRGYAPDRHAADRDRHAADRHAADYYSRGYPSIPGPENIGAHNRMVLEEEVVFKLLCQLDKVGSLIGKGGSIIRALQSETGASIKIADAVPDADERVVVISARENSEQKYSPAQDAVIRVHCRIAEIGFEPGAAVVARLLVHSQQIGCLLGKGGFIISEMRRATGASIRVFPSEQVPKCGSQNDEVVQVIGSLQSVQDALFHITSRLRETIFPIRSPFPSFSAPPPYLPPFPEMPPHQFRPKHNSASPGSYSSPVGPFHSDRSTVPSQSLDHLPAFSHVMDRNGPPNIDRGPYIYGSDRPGHGPSFESSPRSWTPQAVSSGNPRGVADVGPGIASRSGPLGSGSQAPILTSTTIDVVIPQTLLTHVYGENNSNLNQIRQISGANVVVHDPKPGTNEGVVVVSGTPDQMHAAQSLIQAFILCGYTTP